MLGMQLNHEKAKALLESGVVAALTGAVVSAVVTWVINKNEISEKYVEMAVGILSAHESSSDPTVLNQNKALRTWAIWVINKYSSDDSLKIKGDLGRALTNGDVNFNGFGVSIIGKPAELKFASPPQGAVIIKNEQEK